jgi:hypothetical protein
MVLRGKYVLVILSLIIVALVAACGEGKQSGGQAAGPDNEANRTAAAKEYLKAMPPAEILHGLAERVPPRMPEASRKAFMEFMSSKGMQDQTYQICLDALVKNFTVGELHALTAFFGSPDGKSASKKFGVYMSEVMPKIQQEVRAAMVKAEKESPAPQPPSQEQLKKAIEEQKKKQQAAPQGKPGAQAPAAPAPGTQAPGSKAPGAKAPAGPAPAAPAPETKAPTAPAPPPGAPAAGK